MATAGVMFSSFVDGSERTAALCRSEFGEYAIIFSNVYGVIQGNDIVVSTHYIVSTHLTSFVFNNV